MTKRKKIMEEIAEEQRKDKEEGRWHPIDIHRTSMSTTDRRMARAFNLAYNDKTGKWESPPVPEEK